MGNQLGNAKTIGVVIINDQPRLRLLDGVDPLTPGEVALPNIWYAVHGQVNNKDIAPEAPIRLSTKQVMSLLFDSIEDGCEPIFVSISEGNRFIVRQWFSSMKINQMHGLVALMAENYHVEYKSHKFLNDNELMSGFESLSSHLSQDELCGDGKETMARRREVIACWETLEKMLGHKVENKNIPRGEGIQSYFGHRLLPCR